MYKIMIVYPTFSGASRSDSDQQGSMDWKQRDLVIAHSSLDPTGPHMSVVLNHLLPPPFSFPFT